MEHFIFDDWTVFCWLVNLSPYYIVHQMDYKAASVTQNSPVRLFRVEEIRDTAKNIRQLMSQTKNMYIKKFLINFYDNKL